MPSDAAVTRVASRRVWLVVVRSKLCYVGQTARAILPKVLIVKNATRPDLIWDDEARGLCVRVYPDGSNSFIFLYHFKGRQRFIRIGCSPGLSLKAARARARELRRIVDEGRDPAGDERDRRWITSFEKFLRHTAEHVSRRVQLSPKQIE